MYREKLQVILNFFVGTKTLIIFQIKTKNFKTRNYEKILFSLNEKKDL